jgi:hypothetical protein
MPDLVGAIPLSGSVRDSLHEREGRLADIWVVDRANGSVSTFGSKTGLTRIGPLSVIIAPAGGDGALVPALLCNRNGVPPVIVQLEEP